MNDKSNDEIDKIIAEFQKSNELRRQQESKSSNNTEKIDFAAENQISQSPKVTDKKDKQQKKKAEKASPKKPKPAKTPKKGKESLTKKTKAIIIFISCIICVLASILIIVLCVNKANNSYLTPYEKQYNVKLPNGMIEEYAEAYAKNDKLSGVLTIGGKSIFVEKLKSANSPYTDINCNIVSFGFNTVIYGTKKQLGNIERQYGSATACANSGAYIDYNSMFNRQKWRIVGAYYTNTVAKDDNGYIFPYNLTYDLTTKNKIEYFDKLTSRFIFDGAYTLTRNDKLLTICEDSNYNKNFKFVLVCVATDKEQNDILFKDKTRAHYPQVIYDEASKTNPYKTSNKWYPQVLLNSGKETSQQSIKDYE